ncbi:inactive hydroxysteroid dehydrogenase-like protein 1 [Centruroides sculpturatus]|uniref:inactive hydroxysteroid dehydrogenase-like protein 1 n=1 Tax=Centruroides sculpturatus TaxID=218467 RepID=UPI000C6D4D5C|nr:inactive hydroxysteroid dehydrogenase-like protein 1 [Centruroides sculpturatus]
MYDYFLIAVGVLTTISAIYSFFRFIYLHFLLRFFHDFRNEYGEWAVITGGNAGIGRSYALQLAEKGMNVIIVGRDQQTLRSTAEEIESTYGNRCLYIRADLSEEGAVRDVVQELQGKDVGLFIHNAGFLGNLPRLFLDETTENVLKMITLQVTSVVQLTRCVLPWMLTKENGAMIFVTSFSSLFPTPRLNVYSASKAFCDRFSRSILGECLAKGVHIQTLSPFYVSTKFIKFKKIDVIIPSSDRYVRDAIRTLGISDYTSGYWLHDILKYLAVNYRTILWKWFTLKSMLRIKKRLQGIIMFREKTTVNISNNSALNNYKND